MNAYLGQNVTCDDMFLHCKTLVNKYTIRPPPHNFLHDQWRDLQPVKYGHQINPRHVPCPVMKLGLDNQSMDVIVIPSKHHMII